MFSQFGRIFAGVTADHGTDGDVANSRSESLIGRALAGLQRVLNHQVSIGALMEVALWLAIPYLAIGFVWSSLHGEQVRQIQTRVEKVSPVGADVAAFGLATALWPASIQIADACPAS